MKIEFDEYEEKLNLVTITETTTAPPIQSLHRNHQFNSLMHFSTNDQYNRRSSNSISSSSNLLTNNDNDLFINENNNHNSTTTTSTNSNGTTTTTTNNMTNIKIKMEFIDNKLRRYTTFSKRKTGIMKKAYELSTLTGTQVMLLVASETGHVYTFATRKLQPMITSDAGKALIQTCLNSPDPGVGSTTTTLVTIRIIIKYLMLYKLMVIYQVQHLI
ncbi:hypothetical protein DERP_001103, partial [Dermatophagoides pteronyssinus]